MAKVVDEDVSRFLDPESLEAQVREYSKLKASMNVLESRAGELREKLFEHLDLEGFEDDKGNIQLELPTPIDGIVRLEKQRRVKRALNELIADDIIEQAGIADDVYEMKRVINEDALMAAFYEGKITEEQLDEMFPATVIWALRPMKK